MPTQVPEAAKHTSDQMIPGTIGMVRLFGVPVRLHFTFVLLLIFLVFIGVGERQSGALTALYILALFGSVLLHELGHALVGRRYGIRTLEVVMFPIGGVARLERMPKAREELWIASAGPLVNVLIAGVILGILWQRGGLLPVETLAQPSDANLAHRIALGNLILAGFNLLPAYPMDGGRILRSLLARFRTEDDATRIAARAGQALAIAMGLGGLLSSNFMLVFVAMFVYLGATQEAAAVRGRTLTAGYPVRAAMITDFRTLSHSDTIRDAGNLLLSVSQQDFPVMHGGRPVGLLTRNRLMRAMLAEGPDAFVAGAMDRDFPRLSPDQDLSEALPVLAGSGSCALVMDGDQLLGLLTSENLSEFLMLRQISRHQPKTGADSW
jgi:Zn-dependent protease/CBS domain-containing protein